MAKTKDILKKTVPYLIFLLSLMVYFVPSQAPCQTIEDCIECHMDRNLTKTDAQGKVHSLYVDNETFLRSVPFKQGFTCVKCHEGVEADEHPEGGIPDVECGKCHENELKEYEKSKHGILLLEGNPDAPQCYDCHTKHSILPGEDPESSTNIENQSDMCGKCHEEEVNISVLSLAVSRFKAHGKVNMACEFTTKHCTYCHFEIKLHADTDNNTDKIKPEECVNCHEVSKNSFLFGKIHKADVFNSTLLIVMLICLYAAGIILFIFYFRSDKGKKDSGKDKN